MDRSWWSLVSFVTLSRLSPPKAAFAAVRSCAKLKAQFQRFLTFYRLFYPLPPPSQPRGPLRQGGSPRARRWESAVPLPWPDLQGEELAEDGLVCWAALLYATSPSTDPSSASLFPSGRPSFALHLLSLDPYPVSRTHRCIFHHSLTGSCSIGTSPPRTSTRRWAPCT